MADQEKQKFHSIRCFLAIEISESLRREAREFVDQIKGKYPQFRFIEPNHWHLTLHFFGSLSPNQIKHIQEELPRLCSDQKPFYLSLAGFGAFPNVHQPNLLWMGVSGDLQEFADLKTNLDGKLRQMKFPVETRAFQPHLTIARLRGKITPSPSPLPLEGGEGKGEGERFAAVHRDLVNQIVLFQSVLSSTGARYIPLNRFQFGLGN